MSNSTGMETNVVPWRRIRAALPAVALIAAGINFAAPVPPRNIASADVSKHSPAIVVPDTPLTMPAAGGPGWTGPFAVPDPKAPAVEPPVGSTSTLMPPSGSAPTLTSPNSITSSTTPAVLDSTGIPVRALDAYRKAATLVRAADPACNIDWALLAAIGRVESNHARFGGNQLDSAGVAHPGIIGIPLDGTNGTALIRDTDGGKWDGDTVYDRAVGPMQFIPGTWRAVGVDGDGDGVKNPQDMADAATSAAVYLCSGPGDLTRPGDLHSAIMRYNPSDSYVATVTSIADTYRHGVTALPASYLPPARSTHPTREVAKAARIRKLHVPAAPATAGRAQAASAHAAPAPAAPAPATPPASTPPPPAPPLQAAPVPGATAPAPGPGCLPNPGTPIPAAQTTDPGAPVAPASGSTEPCPTRPTTCLPGPAAPLPAAPDPAIPAPVTPVPAAPALAAPSPAIPDPATPGPAAPAACEPVPAAPTPVLPGSCPTVPDPAAPTPGLTPTAGTPASTPPTKQVCTTAP